MEKARSSKVNPKTDLETAVQRFIELYDFAPMPYVSFDRVGRIEEINFAASKLLKRPRNRLLGQPFTLCVAREDAERFLRHLLLCRSEQKMVETYLKLHDSEGELISVYLSSTPTASFVRNGAQLFQTAIVDLRERERAEAEVRAREERYRTLFNMVPVAVYTCDESGHIKEFNQNAADLWGRQPNRNGAHARYCGSFKMYDSKGRPMSHAKSPMARALRGETLDPDELEILIEQPSGARRNVISSPNPLRNETGKIIGAINCLYDITARKRAETELGQRKNELDLILRQTPFMLTRCSRDLRYLYVSNEYARVAGGTPEEIAGKRLVDVMGKEGLASIRPYIKKVLSGKRVDYETLVPFKNGDAHFLRGTYLPDKNAKGQVIGWIASLVDITERKKAEIELRESEEQLRAFFDQNNVAMGRTDLEGNLTFVNDKFCKMLDYTRKELIGKSISDRTHPADLEKNMRLFNRMVSEGIPYEMEKRYLRKDGSTLWASVSASPIRDINGKPESGVVVVLDITARKKAEEGLREAKQLLETRVRERTAELLAANEKLRNEVAQRKQLEGELLEVSDREQRRLGQDLHDSLCQHLTATAYMAQVVALRLKDHRVVEVQDIEKIAKLINDGVSEARTIARGLHPVEMDSAGLATALESLLHRQSNLPYRLDVDEEIAITDPTIALHLYRIAREAVINANKHARARELVVRMQQLPKQIELCVTDDGVGLPKKKSDGEGMGFHIMNYRARSIGARLEITNVKPHGTRVACYLPRA
jgi:PAS domain S-box-containing protein